MKLPWMLALVGVLAVGLVATLLVVGGRDMEEPIVFGPADGLDLAPTDLERVAVGTEAPDFTLESYAGAPETLSGYRGRQNVVLVFYRGHW